MGCRFDPDHSMPPTGEAFNWPLLLGTLCCHVSPFVAKFSLDVLINSMSLTSESVFVLGSLVVKALGYKPEGRGFETR
jgi:hypothetical protein